MSEILNVLDEPVEDKSIKKIDFQTINPSNPLALGNNDVLHFVCHRSNSFILLHRSYFLVSGRITVTTTTGTGEATKTVVTAPAHTKLNNGGALHLFNRGDLKINNQTVEQVNDLGLTGLARIYTTYNDWDARHLQVMGFGDGGAGLDSEGYFHNLMIPVRVVFGVGEDHRHVLINPKIEVQLTRSRTDDNAVICSQAETYKLTLEKVQLRLAFVDPADPQYLRLLKIVERNKQIPVAFRAFSLYQYPELPQTTKISWPIKTTSPFEKPRYAIFFMQNKRDGDPLKDSSHFDHNDLRSLVLCLNNHRYPEEEEIQSFSKSDCNIFYHRTAMMSAVFNGIPDATPLLSLPEFKNKVTIFVIDCSAQPEDPRDGAVDVKLIIESNKRFSAGVTASCILVHDTHFTYNPLTSVTRKHEG